LTKLISIKYLTDSIKSQKYICWIHLDISQISVNTGKSKKKEKKEITESLISEKIFYV